MFKRSELKAEAKKNLTGNWSYMAGLHVLVFVISLASGFVLSFIPVIGQIISSCIALPFQFSFILIAIMLYKNMTIGASSIFNGFKYAIKVICLSIWISILTFLWSLLFIIPGIIKAYSYSMALYALANEPDLTIGEALRESIRITKGFKMDLFVLDLSWVGWIILCIFTCGIGVLFLNPYMIQTKYLTYRFLKTHAFVYVEYQDQEETLN